MRNRPTVSIVSYLNQVAHTRDQLTLAGLNTAGHNKLTQTAFWDRKQSGTLCELQCLKTSPVNSQCARSINKFGPKNDTNTTVRGTCFGDRNTG